MNLKAVAHAQRHRPAINPPQAAPEAVAVAEAVGQARSPLAAITARRERHSGWRFR